MDPLIPFIAAIATGETAVMGAERLPGADGEDLRAAVAAAEAAARLEAPGRPPAGDIAVGTWAWRMLYHVAALVVHRDLGPEEIAGRLGAPAPAAEAAVAAWSADVAFRHLPTLHRVAVAVSPGDPLAAALRDFAAAWPLSGVGFAPAPAVGDARLAAVLAHPALKRLYVDRALAVAERERFAVPAVATAARAALGGHPDMLPLAAAALAAPEAASSSAVISGTTA
jgi:hypothetical protein